MRPPLRRPLAAQPPLGEEPATEHRRPGPRHPARTPCTKHTAVKSARVSLLFAQIRCLRRRREWTRSTSAGENGHWIWAIRGGAKAGGAHLSPVAASRPAAPRRSCASHPTSDRHCWSSPDRPRQGCGCAAAGRCAASAAWPAGRWWRRRWRALGLHRKACPQRHLPLRQHTTMSVMREIRCTANRRALHGNPRLGDAPRSCCSARAARCSAAVQRASIISSPSVDASSCAASSSFSRASVSFCRSNETTRARSPAAPSSCTSSGPPAWSSSTWPRRSPTTSRRNSVRYVSVSAPLPAQPPASLSDRSPKWRPAVRLGDRAGRLSAHLRRSAARYRHTARRSHGAAAA